ncbi:formate dehydrogenase accessory protein FdhE [Candidatus Oleimmundimicrobium sp.]|uniref:formate dehydrogenase accessory protein FdhE n=1 Tax=Candidatus Oleimmundimicrobium sp. TaxID=3060597 RepID=UPI00271A6F6F|nr:formate dehydrogenase accessory protein FdhE [Candidatus Oleimmundimicrobium sp.]MDO8886906.1 formate dehydrogenase accessory protein FdhE [Candidatus Oleimmundimicrobium sp.]
MFAILKLEQKIPSKKDIEEEINFYKKKFPTLERILNLFGSIFELQLEYVNKIDVSGFDFSEDEIAKILKGGTPLLSTKRGEISSELFRELLTKLVEIVKEKSLQKPIALDKILEADELKTKNIGVLIEKFEEGDNSFFENLCKEKNINKDVLLFMITNTLSPFYEAYSLGLRSKINHHHWGKEFCPICGNRPYIMKLRKKDGLKLQSCSVCKTEWWTQRIRCAFCGNVNNKLLSIFYPEDDKGHQVELCDKCKRYGKLSNEKELGRDVILRVEDVATIHLDAVAKKKGYSPITQSPIEMN